MLKSFFILLINLLFCTPLLALDFAKYELHFDNGKKLIVELADDHEKRTQGLMNRTTMAENEGMLFAFESPQSLSFWMKDTFIPLSIAYFDKDKKLKEIYQMQEQNMLEKFQDVQSYPSRCRCQFALEVNKGWFKKNKVSKGATFKLVPKSSSKTHKKTK